MNLAWIFPEVLITFRSVKAEIQTFCAGLGWCWAGAGLMGHNRGQAQLGSALLSFDNSVVCTLNIYVQGQSLKYCLFRESEHIETMTTLTDYMTSPQTLGLK